MFFQGRHSGDMAASIVPHCVPLLTFPHHILQNSGGEMRGRLRADVCKIVRLLGSLPPVCSQIWLIGLLRW
jgi:hypothetical protein